MVLYERRRIDIELAEKPGDGHLARRDHGSTWQALAGEPLVHHCHRIGASLSGEIAILVIR